MTRFIIALTAGVAGLIAGAALSVVALWFAGRFASSLFAILAIVLAFPTVGFALAFQLVWLRKDGALTRPPLN